MPFYLVYVVNAYKIREVNLEYFILAMCANFKPLTLTQLQQLQLPVVGFSYAEEVYPAGTMPLLFKSPQGLEWREVMFGLVPKWAEDTNIAKHTYNARHETISNFIEGFPVEEFECSHVPKEKIIKPTPQLSMFD